MMAATDVKLGAVSSSLAQEVYGLRMVAENIEDQSNNITRFLIIGRDDSRPSGDDKTSLVFSVQDRPGILHRMLEPFAKSRINLTKIESRPLKNKPWEYMFFIDFKGHKEESGVRRAIRKLRKLPFLESFRLLPKWNMNPVDRVPEYIRALVPYQPGKPIEEVEREYGISNSSKLASNENPLGPSARAIAAIRAKLDQLHLYPDGDCFYLKSALANKLRIDAERLIFGNGSNELIELAVRTFMRPGDEAVMARQAFLVYPLVVQAVGGVGKVVALKNFTHDLSAIGEAIGPSTRIVFLANPNNPTGTIYRRDEWERFLQQVPADVLIIVDEAYFEYVRDPDYPDSLKYHAHGKTLLTLRTFSKLYGLAGLRIGYG